MKHIWKVSRLWLIAKDLPVFEYNVFTFGKFSEDCWFGDRIKPTIENVLKHHEKILKADLNYPIIISEDGTIMDGIHRICRAYLEGRKTIPAVQFLKNPDPDEIIPL